MYISVVNFKNYFDGLLMDLNFHSSMMANKVGLS